MGDKVKVPIFGSFGYGTIIEIFKTHEKMSKAAIAHVILLDIEYQTIYNKTIEKILYFDTKKFSKG